MCCLVIYSCLFSIHTFLLYLSYHLVPMNTFFFLTPSTTVSLLPCPLLSIWPHLQFFLLVCFVVVVVWPLHKQLYKSVQTCLTSSLTAVADGVSNLTQAEHECNAALLMTILPSCPKEALHEPLVDIKSPRLMVIVPLKDPDT